MKAGLDPLKKISRPKKEYRAITVLVLVFVSIVLIITASADQIRSNIDNLRNWLPKPSDLATSPIAMKALKQKQDQSLHREPQTKTESNPKIVTVPAAPAAADRTDIIIIPKLGVTAPIVTAQTPDAGILKSLLDSGVLMYPGSADFGDNGQTVVLGHSAPAGWPNINYETIFSRLVELSAGDKVIVVYNDKTYNYSVVGQKIIEKEADAPASGSTGNTLFLVTGWPPGRDLKRIIIEATLVWVE
jgi:LPXTG-site transpeptidase (sortase) family protein